MSTGTLAKLAYTIPQAVEASGISRSSIYLAIASGRLAARKAGKRTLIQDRELRRFLAGLPTFVAGGAR